MFTSMKIYSAVIVILLLAALTLPLQAAVEFAGNLTGVSTYVWRGIKANNGPALQSDAAFTYGIITLGFWGSSIDFGDDLELETDPYGSVVLTDGDFSSSLGFTVYMFDFHTFNQFADAELELSALFGYGPIGLNIFYVPKQNSTKEDLNRSLYWLRAIWRWYMDGC